jgi:gamma-glutamyl hercynylcysteine S-oxide synthase
MWLRFVLIVSGLCAQKPVDWVPVSGGEFRFHQENRWRESLRIDRLIIGPIGQAYVIDRTVKVAPYRIGRTEVTNAQYKRFIDASGYRPKFDENYLRHWKGASPPAALAEHPVVWVDLDDAQAYCKWSGGDLPTEEQWQLAAQGMSRRLYPWGNDPDPEKANVRSSGTKAVGSYPAGASPYGALDMVGNVWEWTDSKQDDGRHWFSYLRGGAWFQALTSVWYPESGLVTNEQRLHFWWQSPGLNRTSTTGFRCAAPAAN